MEEIDDPFFDPLEDEVAEEDDFLFAGVPALVLLVDVRKRMFSVDDGMQEIPVILSLQCIRQWVRDFIFASGKCFCSVVLVGSGTTKNSVSSKNICVASDLKMISVDTVKQVDRLINLVREKKFLDEYGTGDFSLADALWISSNMLTEMKRKLRKHVILFTNDGCPFPKIQDKVRVFAKIADMKNSKIMFQLIPFGTSFDSQFYKELLDEMGDGWDDEKCGSVLKLSDAIDRGPKHRPHHVPLANVPFVISEDFSVPIQIHTLVTDVKLPFATILSTATNLPVTTKSTLIIENEPSQEAGTSTTETLPGHTVNSENYVFHENLGSECITFKPHEMDKINAVAARQLQLLGFKPRSTLSLENHVKPCGFVYPDEKRAKGASQFIHALMESCRKKDVVAICSFCPRPTSTVQYVALDVNVSPPGFLMITLPFGDEIRDTDEECLSRPEDCASAEQVNIMENIVKKFRREFHPKDFPNPPLAAYWAGIEALALDLPKNEEIVDSSDPDTETMSQRLGSLTDEFHSSFYPDVYTSSGTKSTLRQKISDPLADIAAVEDNYENNTMHKLTLDQLKTFLKSVGLGIGLSKKKKGDLISMVSKYLKKTSGN